MGAILIVVFIALFVILAWAGMKWRGILPVALLTVFATGCATSGYGVHTPLGSARTSDLLCAALGAGGGYGVSKGAGTVGGVITGAVLGVGCKMIADRLQGPTPAYAHEPFYGYGGGSVIHHPSPVLIGAPQVICPKEVRTRATNATKAVVFVMTPGGEHQLSPGGVVILHECRGTGAGAAFYAVNARAVVIEGGQYFTHAVHEWAHPTGGYVNGLKEYAVEFKPHRWETETRKLVPSPAAIRHDIVPPDAIYGSPSVQGPPAAPAVPQAPSLPPRPSK